MKKLFTLILLAFALNVNAQVLSGHRYRGMVDGTFLYGNDGVFEKMNSTGFGISTSHGYQVNSLIFIGGGIAYHSYTMDHFDSQYAIPVFANFRVNMNSKKISPLIPQLFYHVFFIST